MNGQIYQDHKSSIGNLQANIVALLAYVGPVVLAWIPYVSYVAWALPLVFFLLEKNSYYVKFHSMQALLIQAVRSAISILFAILTAAAMASFSLIGLSVLGILGVIVGILFTVVLVFGAVSAYKYEAKKLPLVGNLAEKIAGKQ